MFYDNSELVIQLFTGVECSMISEFVIQAVGFPNKSWKSLSSLCFVVC